MKTICSKQLILKQLTAKERNTNHDVQLKENFKAYSIYIIKFLSIQKLK